MKKTTTSILTVISLVGAAAVNAAVTVTYSSSTVAHNGTFEGSSAPSSSDLLQTSVASVVTNYTPWSGYGGIGVLTDGGATGDNSLRTLPGNPTVLTPTSTAPDRSGFIVTYNLDLSAAPDGYDITDIVTFAGNGDYRARQEYQIWYTLVGSSEFIQLISPTYSADRAPDHSQVTGNGALSQPFQVLSVSNVESRLAIDIEGLTNVSAIRFVTQPASGNSLTGGATVYREFDVIGVASVPEPSAWILGAVAGCAGLVRRRRK